MAERSIEEQAAELLLTLSEPMRRDYVRCVEHCPERVRTGRALARRGLVRDVGGRWWAPVDMDLGRAVAALLAAEVNRG